MKKLLLVALLSTILTDAQAGNPWDSTVNLGGGSRCSTTQPDAWVSIVGTQITKQQTASTVMLNWSTMLRYVYNQTGSVFRLRILKNGTTVIWNSADPTGTWPTGPTFELAVDPTGGASLFNGQWQDFASNGAAGLITYDLQMQMAFGPVGGGAGRCLRWDSAYFKVEEFAISDLKP